MATKTTTGAGDWNDPANWDAGVPTVDDVAVVDHNMTVNSSGATFYIMTNSAIILCTGSTVAITIKDGGIVDNSSGTINANNQDVTFKAATGVANWTWIVDAGTITEGTGEWHWEHGTLITASGNKTWVGKHYYDENMSLQCTGATRYFYYTTASETHWAAGKTFTLSDGTNNFSLDMRGVVSAVGTSGSRITFDEQDHAFFWCRGNAGTYAIQYCDFQDGLSYCYRADGLKTANFTMDNCTFSGSTGNGLYIILDSASETITITDCTAYSNTTNGFYCQVDGTINFTDCVSYSNTNRGFHTNVNDEANLLRCKAYGNGYHGFEGRIGITEINASSCLAYENTYSGFHLARPDSGTIINCTSVDNSTTASYANYYIDVSATFSYSLTNSISKGGLYGVNAVGAVDPTVTYCDVTGASTADYANMTDPTGSDGNISADPEFANAANDDYSIVNGSPCQNTGTDGGVATDINNVAWPNANPEMGCYGKLILVDTGNSVFFGCNM